MCVSWSEHCTILPQEKIYLYNNCCNWQRICEKPTSVGNHSHRETRFFVTILFLTTHLQSGQSLQTLCLFLNMVYDMSQPTALHPPICGCGWVRQSYCSVMGVCKGFLYICGTGRLFWIWKQLSVLWELFIFLFFHFTARFVKVDYVRYCYIINTNLVEYTADYVS